MLSPHIIAWKLVDFGSVPYVLLRYSDGDVFAVSKSDFDRAFGPILSGDKDTVWKDFAIF